VNEDRRAYPLEGEQYQDMEALRTNSVRRILAVLRVLPPRVWVKCVYHDKPEHVGKTSWIKIKSMQSPSANTNYRRLRPGERV
jgi:hypothetical protein